MAFPKYLFVIEKKESDGSKFFMEYRDQTDAAEESGGTPVATYLLTAKHKLEVVRTIKFVGLKKRKRSTRRG